MAQHVVSQQAYLAAPVEHVLSSTLDKEDIATG